MYCVLKFSCVRVSVFFFLSLLSFELDRLSFFKLNYKFLFDITQKKENNGQIEVYICCYLLTPFFTAAATYCIVHRLLRYSAPFSLFLQAICVVFSLSHWCFVYYSLELRQLIQPIHTIFGGITAVNFYMKPYNSKKSWKRNEFEWMNVKKKYVNEQNAKWL